MIFDSKSPPKEVTRRNIFVWVHGLSIKNKTFFIAPIELLDRFICKRDQHVVDY